MTKQELAELIYKEFYNETHKCIDLSGLNFTKYNCDVYIDNMTTMKDLHSGGHKVGGNLYQGFSEVEKSIYQYHLSSGKHIYQNGHEVGGDLEQGDQRVKGNLNQSENIVDGDLAQTSHQVGGTIGTYAPSDDDEVDDSNAVYGGYITIKQNAYAEEEEYTEED